MSLFDICFNFTHTSFRKDESDVLQRALDAGVSHFLVTGSDLEDSHHSVQLANTYKNGMYATTGVHPHLANLSLIHISEPTRLLSISYAVFCLKKKNKN